MAESPAPVTDRDLLDSLDAYAELDSVDQGPEEDDDRRTPPPPLGLLLATLWLIFCALIPAAVLALPGCAGWQAPPAVSIAGATTTRANAVLVAIESMQGDLAIARGENPLQTVAPRWDRFWVVWRSWVAAQNAWADAYDARAPGLAQVEAAARGAFCGALALLPPEVPQVVVMVDGLTCEILTLPAGPAVLPMVDGGAR